MKKYISNYTEIKIRLLPETFKSLKLIASKNNEPVAVVVRRILSKNVSEEAVIDNINTVSDVVRRVVRDVIRAETDRLAKLIVKNMKASAASMYQGAQIVEDIGQNSGKDILENSIKMAVEYIKTSFDSDNISFGSHGKEQNNEQFDDDDF